MAELTDLERQVLDFAGLTWRTAGAREQAILGRRRTRRAQFV